MDCVDALSDLKDQERELATQKLDSILDHYQWRIDRLDAIVDQNNTNLDLKTATGIRIEERDYQDAINATTKKINELISSKKALTAEFSDMIARGYIKEGSEDWYNYTSEIEELNRTITETKIDLQDLRDDMDNIALANLQYALSYLESSAAAVNDLMSLHDAQGTDNVASDYEKLIRNGMQQIKNLEAQNAELLKQQNGLDVLSEKYNEIQDQIESNNRSIMDMKASQEQWNDAVLDLKISELEKFRDELTKTNDKYEKQLELQQAIEDLQRASTQRTQRVFRDGIGLVYETNADELQQAQEKFDQVLHNQTLDKIDEVIDSINDFKNDTNVYDINGNLLGQQYSLPNISDLSALMENVRSNNALSSVTEEAFKAAYNEVMRNITNGNTETNLSIGDVIVNGAETPDELAEAIVNDLPNAMVQALYKKLK